MADARGGSRGVLIGAALTVIVAIAAGIVIAWFFWKGSNQIARTSTPAALNEIAPALRVIGGPDAEATVPTVSQLLGSVVDDAPKLLSVEEVINQALPAVAKVQSRNSVGSAFFVSADTLLTSGHVVGAENTVTIRMADGRERHATADDAWRNVDLAVLKIDVIDPDQPILRLADSADIRIGEEVIAIGSAAGLQNTVTRGIISARRDYVYDRIGHFSMRVIQTDAAINPGNSGGPLIDRYGRVVGVNTRFSLEESEGLGFAIDVDYARRIIDPAAARKASTRQPGSNALATYEQMVVKLADRADEADIRWNRVRPACVVAGSALPTEGREWFVFWNGAQGVFREAPACQAWRPFFAQWTRAIHDALDALNAKAAEAAVPVGKLHQIRRAHKLSWPDWEK